MTDLLSAYSGENAKKYDQSRKKSPRWAREEAVMKKFLDQVKPTSVLDCPFGTGRWNQEYADIGAKVVGVDLSEGMLAEAKQKFEEHPEIDSGTFHLIQASIFDIGSQVDVGEIDCAICIRFVNWISVEDVDRALGAISSTSAKKFILGASVVPVSAGFLKRLWMKYKLNKVNRKRVGLPDQHVHAETDVLKIAGKYGWELREKEHIFSNKSRENFFYLFAR